jgi:CheY-specific phosphatase CheX
MRAVVKNNIGVFYPQGFLDGNNTPSFFTLEDIRAAEQLHVEMLLVSLKKVIFFNNNGIDIFVQILQKMRAKRPIVIGFCDYDKNKYDTIRSFYKNDISFSLFWSLKIATLFSSSYQNQSKTVLVYDNDPSQRSAIAIELFDRGHNPVIAQTFEEFAEKEKQQENYFAVINNTFLGSMGQKIATRVKGNAVIYTVSGFLDTNISDNFDIIYHNNSLNVGFRLFIFDAYKVVSMNIHALNFFSKLSSSAAEYNATICFAGLTFEKTPQKFKNDMEDFGILFFDNLDDILKDKKLLTELGGATTVKNEKKRSLTKLTVQELPRFIDAIVSTMEMMTNSKAQKEAVNIQPLHIEDEYEKFASSIGFYGGIDGIIILVFPKKVAQKSCELLIGEKTDDTEQILDALAEFVNIIGGRIKTILKECDTDVDITLPRTYENIATLLEVVDERKGIQVDLSFNNERFTFFLAR